MTRFIDHYELSLAEVAAGQRVPIPLFPIGEWKSAKYPSLPLTRDLADQLVANFEAGILGTEPVLDSSGKHDTSAPAAGWFKKLYVAPTRDGGEMLFGDAELTDLGAEQLNAGLYKYDSIEIGSVVDNESGAKTDNVFRSATLTNTPVLRMLPPVLDAGGAIAMSEPVVVALSEVTLADSPTVAAPAAPILEDMEANDGASGEPLSADSEPVPAAEGEEGTDAALSENARPKGGAMKSVALKLNLAEDASEELILAEVVKLAEERDAEKARADEAEGKLAEEAKRVRAEAVERTLSELIEGGHLLPGQKAEMLALAEDSASGFDRACAVLKTAKAIDLGESGDGRRPEPASEDVTAELAEAAMKLAAERGIAYGEAIVAVLSEDADLATRYQNRDL